MQQVLKYPGSKQRIAGWIISQMPQHHSYLEPFLGSGAVLLNKPKSAIETVNDLDLDVVTLFRLIRERPEELARCLYATPYSRHEYEGALIQADDELEQVRRFLVRCWQGHGFKTNGKKVGWKNDVQGREAAYAVRNWNRLPGRVMEVVERLKDVQIEQRPAVELIRRFNHKGVLIYADPPYLLQTRSGAMYKYEMTDQDHIELLEALLQHKGSVMLSGYDNPLYREYLRGWHTESIKSATEYGSPRTETLWMNFETQLRLE